MKSVKNIGQKATAKASKNITLNDLKKAGFVQENDKRGGYHFHEKRIGELLLVTCTNEDAAEANGAWSIEIWDARSNTIGRLATQSQLRQFLALGECFELAAA